MKRTVALFISIAVTFSCVTVLASWHTLWTHSPYTKVYYYHQDGLHDEYVGYASVRGVDRVKTNGEWHYFAWTRITFNMQGEYSATTSYSHGSEDHETRVSKVIAYDKWNDGSKTIALYNYSTNKVVSGIVPDAVGALD